MKRKEKKKSKVNLFLFLAGKKKEITSNNCCEPHFLSVRLCVREKQRKNKSD